MARALRKEFRGAKYHVTSRGNGRRRIFHGDDYHQRFMWQLEEALRIDGVILYGYVLMANHYHLLLETPRGNLSQFMHRLNTAYSTYYRFKHRHAGSVFQSRYKSKLVEGDDYLIRLTRYIHLNPVKTVAMGRLSPEERVESLKRYQWSSYPGYVLKSKEEEIVNYRWRSLAGGRTESEQRKDYGRYIEGMIGSTDAVLSEALSASVYAIGDEGYVAEIASEMRELARSIEDVQDVTLPEQERPTVQDIDRAICCVYGCARDLLRRHGRIAGEPKRVALELVCRLGGLSNRDAGKAYGEMTCAGVTRSRRQLAAELKISPSVAKRVQEVVARVEPEGKV